MTRTIFPKQLSVNINWLIAVHLILTSPDVLTVLHSSWLSVLCLTSTGRLAVKILLTDLTICPFDPRFCMDTGGAGHLNPNLSCDVHGHSSKDRLILMHLSKYLSPDPWPTEAFLLV